MTFRLWLDGDNEDACVSLGGLVPVMRAMQEWAEVMPDAALDDEESWGAFFWLPNADDQDLPPEYVDKLREQVARYIAEYGTKLSPEALAVLVDVDDGLRALPERGERHYDTDQPRDELGRFAPLGEGGDQRGPTDDELRDHEADRARSKADLTEGLARSEAEVAKLSKSKAKDAPNRLAMAMQERDNLRSALSHHAPGVGRFVTGTLPHIRYVSEVRPGGPGRAELIGADHAVVASVPITREPVGFTEIKTVSKALRALHERHYEDDQPRDENGRWSGAGFSTGMIQESGWDPDFSGKVPADAVVAGGSPITPRVALRSYCADAYVEINHALRQGADLANSRSSMDKITHRMIQALDGIMEKASTPEEATVYRGYGSSMLKSSEEVMKRAFGGELPKIGEVYEEKGFLSTSTDKSVAKNFAQVGTNPMKAKPGFTLELKLPKGSKAIRTDAVRKDEAEVLVHRGARFRITSVVRNKVKAELVP